MLQGTISRSEKTGPFSHQLPFPELATRDFRAASWPQLRRFR
jgi:hypothetical protein